LGSAGRCMIRGINNGVSAIIINQRRQIVACAHQYVEITRIGVVNVMSGNKPFGASGVISVNAGCGFYFHPGNRPPRVEILLPLW
jgi:hypothetical protein